MLTPTVWQGSPKDKRDPGGIDGASMAGLVMGASSILKTPNPKPQTLDPRPHTRNLKALTLNPKP